MSTSSIGAISAGRDFVPAKEQEDSFSSVGLLDSDGEHKQICLLVFLLMSASVFSFLVTKLSDTEAHLCVCVCVCVFYSQYLWAILSFPHLVEAIIASDGSQS